eukprot:m.1640455 g.1640455  ORF g.1640455 m.1640455 type:complete len:61 (-) comp41848_c0_seq1:2209-2391(-)
MHVPVTGSATAAGWVSPAMSAQRLDQYYDWLALLLALLLAVVAWWCSGLSPAVVLALTLF